MARLYFLLLLISLVLAIEVPKESRKKPVRINHSKQALIETVPHNIDDVKYLGKLQSLNIVDLWNEFLADGKKVLMRVHQRHFKDLKKRLSRKKMKFEVVVPNIERLISRERMQMQRKDRNRLFDPMHYEFNRYNSMDEIEAFLIAITNKNNNISRLVTLGTTFEKRPIYAVEISSKPSWLKGCETMAETQETCEKNVESAKKMIIINCGMHAREWAGIAFCVYFLNELITGYKGSSYMKDVLTKYDFIIIPVLNPDGYAYSYTTDRLWRKNRSILANSRCVGVDLNRNFDVGNGACQNNCSCADVYCGDRPFSENETASLDRLLRKTSGRLKAYFDVHTFGQLWMIPWSKTTETVPRHYKDMEKVAEIGAKAIERRFNTSYEVGMSSELTYISWGTAMDYVYEKGFADYSFTLELRDKGKFDFLLPLNQIHPLCLETTDGMVAAIMALD